MPYFVPRSKAMPQTSPQDCTFESYTGHETLVTSLKLIGRAQLASAVPGGRQPHSHPGILEVCCLLRGTAEWSVGSQIYQLKRDDLFVTQPGEEHGGVDGTMHRCELYWMHVKLPLGRNDEDRLLAANLQGLSAHQCPGSPPTIDAIERLFLEHRHRRPFAHLAARCALNEALVGVLRDFNVVVPKGVSESHWSIATKKAMNTIQANLSAHHTIRTLAEEANVSERHLAQRFDAEIGMTPTEYVTNARVEEAKVLLSQTSQSVTKIALGLGFSSSQYFATIFRSRTGRSPLAYRKYKRQSS